MKLSLSGPENVLVACVLHVSETPTSFGVRRPEEF